MLRIFGLLAGFGLLVLLVKGVFFMLPLLAILLFFRLIMGGYGPFGAGRLHPAQAFSQHRQGYSPRRGYRGHADRYTYDACYERRTPAERPAATGPTVRL